jgi:hypothetical protein
MKTLLTISLVLYPGKEEKLQADIILETKKNYLYHWDESFKSSFIPDTGKLWNKLTPTLKEATSLEVFKNRLKKERFPNKINMYSELKGKHAIEQNAAGPKCIKSTKKGLPSYRRGTSCNVLQWG